MGKACCPILAQWNLIGEWVGMLRGGPDAGAKSRPGSAWLKKRGGGKRTGSRHTTSPFPLNYAAALSRRHNSQPVVVGANHIMSTCACGWVSVASEFPRTRGNGTGDPFRSRLLGLRSIP